MHYWKLCAKADQIYINRLKVDLNCLDFDCKLKHEEFICILNHFIEYFLLTHIPCNLCIVCYPQAVYFKLGSQTVAERHCCTAELQAEWARCCGNRLPLWPTDEEHLEHFCSATSFLSPIWPGDVANTAMHVDTWLQGPQIGDETLRYSYLTGLPRRHALNSFHMCDWCRVQRVPGPGRKKLLQHHRYYWLEPKSVLCELEKYGAW